MQKLITILFLLFCSVTSIAQNYYSIVEGMDWTTNSAWSNGSVYQTYTPTATFNTFFNLPPTLDLTYLNDGTNMGTAWGPGSPTPIEVTLSYGSPVKLDSIALRIDTNIAMNALEPDSIVLYNGTSSGTRIAGGYLPPTPIMIGFSLPESLVNTIYTLVIYPKSNYVWIREIETYGKSSCTCSPPFQPGAGDNIFIETNVNLFGNLRLKNGSDVLISAGDTLWVYGDAQFDVGSKLVIENTGALIIIGNLDNKNNSDSIIINGYLSVSGDFSNGTGADITGNGEIEVGGTVTNDGTIGGSTSDDLSDGSLGDGSYDPPVPLPIQLKYFRGKAASNGIVIEWATLSEINNSHFTLEKIGQNNEYEKIATILGAGNSNDVIEYTFVDKYPNDGNNYYRLKQTDYDGTTEEFFIINVRYLEQVLPGLHVYPNPATINDAINVNVTGLYGEEVLVVVQDILGKTYYSKILIIDESNKAIMVIDPYKNLYRGTYMIIGSSNHKLFFKKLIIQ